MPNNDRPWMVALYFKGKRRDYHYHDRGEAELVAKNLRRWICTAQVYVVQR